MKKQIVFLLLWWGLGCMAHQAQAQLSAGLGGTYTRYFSGGKDFPIRNAYTDVPHIMGAKVNLSAGFWEFNAVRFGVGYNVALQNFRQVSNTTAELMHGIDGSIQSFEISADYQRYFVGSYNTDYGIYALGGLSYMHNMINYNIKDPVALAYTGEAKFYDPKTVQLVTFNLGLGAEAYVFDRFYWFLEANAGIHMNAYINDTTIKQSNLMYYARAMTGFRVPFGAAAKSARPKRRRF